MIVRWANENDTIRIIRAIQNKKMDWNTSANVREDIKNHNLIVAEDNGKLLGSVALKYKPHRGYYSFLRMCIYSKKSTGKGVASALIDFALALGYKCYGGTPWNDNPAMIHIFEKRGFKYQYTFKEKYNFYKKVIDN